MCVKKWRKFINLKEAREISKKFCKDFKLEYCEIYFVDKIKDSYAEYIYIEPPHILIEEINLNPIGLLIHELTHHLECFGYEIDGKNGHGYYYQLAKRKVIKWCKSNISSKPDWSIPLKVKGIQNEVDMKNFEI